MPTAAIGTTTALWRIPASGGEAVKVLDAVLNLPFVPAGGGLYYMDMPSNEPRLQFVDLTTRQVTTVAASLGSVSASGYGSADMGFHVSNDGRIILFARQDSSIDDLMLVRNFR
jgi:hypothetical protein